MAAQHGLPLVEQLAAAQLRAHHLIHEARLGVDRVAGAERVHAVHVDNGFMRKAESESTDQSRMFTITSATFSPGDAEVARALGHFRRVPLLR